MIDNYDDLTLGRFMEINEVLTSDASDLEQQAEIIAILSDKQLDEVLALPLGDYAAMAAQTGFLRVPCKAATIQEGFTFQGLKPTEDFSKLTAAQYIDFQTFSKDFPQSMPQLLSAFMVPEGRAYNDGYDIAQVTEQVKEMPLAVAIGLSAFFFERCERLIDASLTFLASEARRTGNRRKMEALEEAVKTARAIFPHAGAGLLS